MTQLQDILGGWRATLAFKAPCRVAATAPITLSGFQTIDGVTLDSTDTNLRVLVTAQADATTNGIYVAQAGTWLRDKDLDGANDIVRGSRVFVPNGNDNAGEYVVSSPDPITIGTSNINFTFTSAPEGTVGDNINVKDAPYGAMGDGHTDDTAAIQAANNAAQAQGLKLYFPGGSDYIVEGQLTITQPVQWIGDGKGAEGTRITFNHTLPGCINLAGATPNNEGLQFTDIYFESNYYGPGQGVLQHCFYILSGTEAMISIGGLTRCIFSNFTGCVIYFQAVDGVASYIQQVACRDIGCNYVGGFLGSDVVTSGLICTQLLIENFNLENGVNASFPQHAFFDFQYAREVMVNQVVMESGSAPASCFRFGGNVSSSVKSLHVEFTPTNVFEFVPTPYQSAGGVIQGMTKISQLYNGVFSDKLILFNGTTSVLVYLEDWNIYSQPITNIVHDTITQSGNIVWVGNFQAWIGLQGPGGGVNFNAAYSGISYLSPGFQNLVDGATINTDASLNGYLSSSDNPSLVQGSNSFMVTIAGSRTLANPTNLTMGQFYTWVITQGSGGSHTLTYGNLFFFAGGTAPTLSTSEGAVDKLVFQFDGYGLSLVNAAIGLANAA